MTQTRWITLAVLLLGALLLAGCGGGDGGVKQDLEAQLEALMAERNAARQAQQTAEAAQTAAEEAQAVAETARQAAETARAAAEAERDTAQAAELAAKAVEAQAVADLAEAQAAEMTAKAAQKAAEAARATAEEARTTADAARKAAEAARATAETERDAAKAAQAEAVAAQAEAVAAQAEAEAAQAESVAAELAAKAAQTAAEAARDAAVKAKTAAEAARDGARDRETQAKIDLIAAQSAQALAERRRDAANTAKTAAETARDAALAARQTAETQRDEALAAEMTAEDALAVANASKTMTEGELATVRQQLTTANANLQTAQDDLKGANDDLEDTNDDLKDAQDDLKEAQGDLQTANDEFATVKKERDDAVRDLARAEGTLEGLRAQLTEAQQDAVDAEQRRREAEREADRRIEQAEQQTNVALRAPNLLEKLVALADGTRESGITVIHAPGERSATFKPNTPATRGTAPSVPGTWNHRASFSSTVGVAATDTFYLYSNIGSPAKRKFWQKYGEDVVSSDTDWSSTLARAGSRRVASRGTDPASTADDIIEYRSSKFDGASGTFTCTGGGDDQCILTNAETVAEGLTIGADTWTFTPSSLRNLVGSDLQDDTYLYFGIWAREPKNASDAMNLNFKWIGSGDSNDITPGNFNDLEGTATFNGGAVGKYALKAVAGREARIGTFTAKATFTASFGTSPTLSGTIDEFKEGGSSLGAGWRVSLIKSETDTLVTLEVNGVSGEAHGSIGGVSAKGNWAATLHGSDNEILAPRTDYPKSQYPAANLAGVVGWFNAFDGIAAAASNAAIAGAFGAACTSGAACGK